MKTARYILAVSVAALSLIGCKKNYLPISDHPFDISTTKIEASRVAVDIVPDNNDFYYLFGVVQAELFETLGQNAFVGQCDYFAKETYKILFETTSLDKFPEWMYRGAYDEVHHGLEPGTRYIVYAYPYDGINPVTDKFTKIDFTTPESKKSDNTFSVSADGSVISVTPSNGDPYFFDYCIEDELKDYFSSIDYFFRKTIDVYWEYGFLDNFISRGPDKEDIKDYYPDLADGDIFYMGISGYDNGITTDVSYYKITFHTGGTAKSTVELVPDFDHTTKSSYGIFSKKCQQ